MRAFDIHEPLPAAGLVLLLMNVATIIPLWPGQRRPRAGRDRAAARPVRRRRTGTGFAFGIGLQAIEASVGVGIGLIFLAREGLSFARLREMPGAVGRRRPGRVRRRRRRRPSVSPRALACPASLKGVLPRDGRRGGAG